MSSTRHPFRYSSRPATSYIPSHLSHRQDDDPRSSMEGRLDPSRRRQVSISSSSTSFTAPSTSSSGGETLEWKKPATGYSLELLNTPALLNDAGIFRSKSAEPFSSRNPRLYKPNPLRGEEGRRAQTGSKLGLSRPSSFSPEEEVNIMSTIYSEDDEEIREARFPSLPNEILGGLSELSRHRLARGAAFTSGAALSGSAMSGSALSGSAMSGGAVSGGGGGGERKSLTRRSLELNTELRRNDTPLTRFFTSSSAAASPTVVFTESPTSATAVNNQMLKERIQGAVGSALIVERGLSLLEQQHGIPISALMKENGVIITLLTDVLFHLCNDSTPSTPSTASYSSGIQSTAARAMRSSSGGSGLTGGGGVEKRRWI